MSDTVQTKTGFAEVNGTRLYYEVAGQGHSLVLIHGGFADRRLWNDQFNVFAQHYKVIHYDVRGFGDSALIKAEDKPYSNYQDLYSLLQYLNIEKTYLLGLSLGGGIAIDFTLEHPEMVDALIPVATGLGGFDFEEWIKGHPIKATFAEMEEAFHNHDLSRAAELSLQAWTDGPARTSDKVNAAVRERVRAMTLHNWERPDDESTQPQELEPPAILRISEISIPTLIIVGDQDIPAILTIADILEAKIKEAKKVIISDTAHHLNMEKPAEFNQTVLDFLQSLDVVR